MSHYYRSRAGRSEFTSARQQTWRRNQNTVAFAPAMNLGPISHTILVALIVTVLGLMYLTQVTKTSAYSYDINAREQQLASLKVEKESLENDNARLQALKNVASSDVAQAMASPDRTEYTQ